MSATFTLTIADGLMLSSSVVAVWATAWSIRVLRRVF